ncbi:PilN domain-containing protein [Thauera sp. CAU 1555]|jgi:type IV pilus assembly protein PilN|uniref:PilN domain-containing protein n=1 Tax=Thauera sedimentorum TaxID=2767595 RepID=A0ABR9BAV0_9RHOO|nr:PilN domain-containing protein [Thauera sedimentorum]MBC9072581.1 PilN domain-containing protein [Thauera sedimentorum]MBD8503500.1 PilN domain-containing protein [Thauera sedimentorum]
MIRINLLPHREIKRKERRQQFYVLSGLMIVLGLAIAFVVHTVIAGYIEGQERKNQIFKTEIAKLDKEIAEIKRLREQIDALLARKQVIESLQSDRAQTVHLLNETAKQIPEGIYLKSIKQSSKRVTLVGYAQSNARVSHLMRALDESPYLTQPQLVEIKAATVDGRRVGEFTLNITIEQPKAEEEGGGKEVRG